MTKRSVEFRGLDRLFEEVEMELTESDRQKVRDSFVDVNLEGEHKHEKRLLYTPNEERAVVSKFDKHLMPFICFVYCFSCMTRTSMGNANGAGMSKDLSLSDTAYSDLLTAYYIGYIIMQWSILLWKVCSPSVYIPCVILAWGVISSCMSAMRAYWLLLAARFLMGCLQACFNPAMCYYLSFFYFRHEQARRNALYMAFSPLSAALSGLISYAITAHPGTAMRSWQLIFLVEGLPSVLGGIIAFYAMVDSPAKAHFLSPTQKEIAKSRTIQQMGSHDRGGKELNRSELRGAVLDLKTWLPTMIAFSHNVASSSLPVFMPVIIEGFGYSEQSAQAFTCPPYIVSIICMLVVCYISDKTRGRGLLVAGVTFVGFIGYVLLAVVEHVQVRYFALFLTSIGIYSAQSVNMTWLGDNHGSDTKKGAAYVLLHLVGEVGPIIGMRIFPSHEAPRYTTGCWICAGCLLLSSLLALAHRYYLAYLNHRLDLKHGSFDQSVQIANDKNPKFRYLL